MAEQWQKLRENITELRDNDGTGAQQEICRFLANLIDALEKQTTQPKMGRWILADEQRKEDTENDNYLFICSKCGCSDVQAKGMKVPYCWSCGAKMQVQEVDE